MQEGYYRYPTSAHGVLAFLAEDDVAVCELRQDLEETPQARRITFHGNCDRPIISPLGKAVAYTCLYQRNREVYVVEISTGRVTQLTFFGLWSRSDICCVGWSADASTVFVRRDSLDGPPGSSEILSVRADGSGEFELIPIGDAHNIYFRRVKDEDSCVSAVIGRHTLDNHVLECWKHYKGGKSGQIWLQIEIEKASKYSDSDTKFRNEKKFVQLSHERFGVFNPSAPFLFSNRVFFVAEREKETANLFSLPISIALASPTAEIPKHQLQQHTFERTYYVRNPHLDQTTGDVVFQCGGAIHRVRPLDKSSEGTSSRIPINVLSDRSWATEKFLDEPMSSIEEWAISCDGEKVAVVVRGRLFETKLWSGPIIELDALSEPAAAAVSKDRSDILTTVRHSCIAYLRNGMIVCAVSDTQTTNSVRIIVYDTRVRVALNEYVEEDQRATRKKKRENRRKTRKRRRRRSASDVGLTSNKKHAVLVLDIENSGKLLGTVKEIVPSNTKDTIAVINHRNELILIHMTNLSHAARGKGRSNLVSCKVSVVESPDAAHVGPAPFYGVDDVSFSPCGRMIAYSRSVSHTTSVICVAGAEYPPQFAPREVTPREQFCDFGPSWDPKGRFIYFLSSREFRSSAHHHHINNFRLGPTHVPMLLFLHSKARSPFVRPSHGPAAVSDDSSDDHETSSTSSSYDSETSDNEDDSSGQSECNGRRVGRKRNYATASSTRVDFKGIKNRVTAFPISAVSPSRYSKISGLKNESGVLYMRHPMNAESDDDDDSSDEEDSWPVEVVRFCFKTQKEIILNDNHSCESLKSIDLSMDLNTMLIAGCDDDDIELYVYESGRSMDSGDNSDSDSEDDDGTQSGKIPLENRLVARSYAPAKEWDLMLCECWLSTKQHFYLGEKSMGGLDWEAVLRAYRPLVSKIRRPTEFEDLLLELLSELGTSHAQASLCDSVDVVTSESVSSGVRVMQGFLGCDVSSVVSDASGERGYRIDRIVRGDVWSYERGGPLARVALGCGGRLRVGDIIVAINGRSMSKISLFSALRGQAGKEVLVSVVDNGSKWHSNSSSRDNSRNENARVEGKHADTSVLRSKTDQKSRKGNEILSEMRNVTITDTSSHAASKNEESRIKHSTTTTADKKKKKKKSHKKKRRNRKKMRRREEGKSNGHRTRENQRQQSPVRLYRVRANDRDHASDARYKDWTSENRAYVHRTTGGRVGYVHVKDCTTSGHGEFTRYYAPESQRDGLIIDIRGNTGGYISEVLLEKLSKRLVGITSKANYPPEPYPADVPSREGVIVLVVDENSVSDADYLTFAFKKLKLGPVVGTRTLGGVVGISESRDLLDGTVVSFPSDGFIGDGALYSIENHGVEPDFIVHIPPGKHDVDLQLSKACTIATQMLSTDAPKSDGPMRWRSRWSFRRLLEEGRKSPPQTPKLSPHYSATTGAFNGATPRTPTPASFRRRKKKHAKRKPPRTV